MIAFGWICLIGSSLLLFLSVREMASPQGDGFFELTAARCCGIGAFMVGVFAILEGRWNQGVLLLIGSVGLPFVSLYFHGSL
ncbi:MAG: hypothetical protein KDD44_04755 [Bdellovibrionales bacterium]|nr:hypothetical protein [Bdellovibrionales bacterium]